MDKKFYLKERHNPQLGKPYYVPLGQISKKEALKNKNCIYGYNNILEFDNIDEYQAAIAEKKENGFTIH